MLSSSQARFFYSLLALNEEVNRVSRLAESWNSIAINVRRKKLGGRIANPRISRDRGKRARKATNVSFFLKKRIM